MPPSYCEKVKDCFYRALGEYVYTVSSYELCPLTVEVP